MDHQPRIFISYVREDHLYASALHQILKAEGWYPFMDTSLLGGEDWFDALESEIRRSDFFLACLSPRAVEKADGFQFREIALALKIWAEEKSRERKVYLIPVKFVRCELPNALKRFQWTDHFAEDGPRKLLQAISGEIERLKRLKLKATDTQEIPQTASKDAAQIEKNNWFRIAYINTRPSNRLTELPSDVANIRDWTWQQSAHVRWFCAGWDEQQPQMPLADLVVLDWWAENSNQAQQICSWIRSQKQELPILLLVSSLGLTPARDNQINSNIAQAAGLPAATITREGLNKPGMIHEAFATLGLIEKLPAAKLKLHHDSNDLESQGIVELFNNQRQLEFALQKCFPQAEHARLAINSGWENSRLCQLVVEGRKHLLRVFDQIKHYEAELNGHLEAEKWLKDAAFGLRLVPDVTDHSEPFRSCTPRLYPLCFELDLPDGQELNTLKQCYGSEKDDFLQAVFAQLLEVLARERKPSYQLQLPWGDEGESPFVWSPQQKRLVLAALNDLKPYGGENKIKWQECIDRLRTLVDSKLPQWLTTPLPVALGPLHGAPTPQNCLVNPSDPHYLKLVSCGEYKSAGRLVSDLALIERDLKLVLLCTEVEAKGYRDLEISELPEWQRIEAEAISYGLEYVVGNIATSSKPVRRAYGLICDVRKQAKIISADSDRKGRHYFAALLYWTLDSLKLPEVHSPKKLLALHSAAEILRAFGD